MDWYLAALLADRLDVVYVREQAPRNYYYSCWLVSFLAYNGLLRVTEFILYIPYISRIFFEYIYCIHM